MTSNKKKLLHSSPEGKKKHEVVVQNTNEEIVALKVEILRWLFSIVGAVFFCILIANILHGIYHPDISALNNIARNTLLTPEIARPEPVEALLFRACVVSCLLALVIFYTTAPKLKFIETAARHEKLFSFLTMTFVLLLVATIYFDFHSQNPFAQGGGDQPQHVRDFTCSTNFSFFFDSLFLGDYFLMYIFLIVPAMSYLFLIGLKKNKWELVKSYKIISSVIGYTVTGLSLLAILTMNAIDFPYTTENKYDFNAVYYSMTQVFSGLPMLVDGFTNTYGLYPQFLNPIFHLIGLNVFKFSLVLSILTVFSFVMNFFVLRKYVSTTAILFLGFATILFFPYFDFKLLTSFDCSFAFFPIRYIIPSTLTFLAAIYLEKKVQWLYWVTFIIAGIFVLWNPEFGLVCYVAWIAANIYCDFYSAHGEINFRKILVHLECGVLILPVVLFLYRATIFLIYHRVPDIGLLFSTITSFSKIGLGLLPMSLIHPWNVEAMVFIFCFTYCIAKWHKRAISAKSSIILMLSVIGLGFLLYFQGRSHNWSFSVSSIVALLLLTLIGDELWTLTKKSNLLALNSLFVTFLFLISFSFFEIVFDNKKIVEMVYQEDDKANDEKEQVQIDSSASFVYQHSKDREKIFILTAMPYQSLYYNGSQRQSAFNPGLIDLLTKADLNRMKNIIRDSAFNIFIQPSYFNYFFLRPIYASVASSYQLKTANSSMAILSKRTVPVPKNIFFTDSKLAFHRKYSDDSLGLNKRIDDAEGIEGAQLGPEFSVEVLFYSSPQIYQFANVIGNMNDSAGFAIAKVINTPNYFFGVNGKGVSYPVPENRWIFCVMNIFKDHFQVYVNDTLVGTQMLPQAIKSSPEKLSVGNIGFLRYFIGPISEVAITVDVLGPDQVHKTWGDVNQNLASNTR